MIDYETLRSTVSAGLKEHLGVPVIRGNQTAAAPPYPFVSYNITTIAGANRGTWQEHDDGKDRKMVKSIWSISTLSDDWNESVSLAIKARDWLEHTGRIWLSDRGITVQSTTDITNRDNILTVEYERKNGFDVVFYVYDVVDSPKAETGLLEDVSIGHERID